MMPRPGSRLRTLFPVTLLLVTAGLSGLGTIVAASSPAEKIEIAAAVSLTGERSAFGTGSLEGIQLAVDEANASGISPRIDLKVYDNASTPETAATIATQIVSSPAVLVIGPGNTMNSLAAGPIYAQAGLASITTTATSDLITDNATTFRILFKNSEQGEMLATYLFRVLGQKRAALLLADDAYGHTIEKGFRTTAERLGIDAKYYIFKGAENAEEVARNAATEIGQSPVVLAMLDAEGARVLPVLRRLGVKGPFLGGNPFAIETFNSRFAELPEEKNQPGYFCESLYAITPMLLDSANADIMSFAGHFKARFGRDPGWTAVAGYDAALAAIEAVRSTTSDTKMADVSAQRAAALGYLRALNEPSRAPSGLLGPIVFDSARGRQAAIRMGRFNRGHLESAPLQIVPVLTPLEADVNSGAVFEISPGRYVRLQQVIYSGIFLNEIMWMEQARSTFAADFYVWLRFTKNTGPDAADPTDIKFPNLSEGRFDREHPVEQREMPDGTSYFLWRVQAAFRNNFDLRRYPFDRQTLTMRFVNSRAAADRIVYALDQTATQGSAETTSDKVPFGTAEGAFGKLTQWKFVSAHQQRENFVARSSLGDPRRLGRENHRELSGYASSIDLQRRSFSTLMKNLLPLFIMTAILYASLHFPSVLMQVKIGVAMTAVLTGMVLLNSVNAQLGAIGYTVVVEYAFYIFFALGLLHVVAVLIAERLREIGRPAVARRTDLVARVAFLAIVISSVSAAFFYA
jgi:ABC-type branched-subunit amino acid transport system substrate-binding protein